MIQRYLGNKNSMTAPIIQEVDRCCEPGDLVCDIFSGTISVSMALKTRGYRVVSNDISSFSYHFANCYLENNNIPQIDLAVLGFNPDTLIETVNARIDQKRNTEGFHFLDDANKIVLYRNIVNILVYLESINETDIAEQYRANYFFNTYTEEGNNSHFHSIRGSEGNRRFFTPANGKKLDNILNKIREWHHKHLLNDVLYSLLVSIVCESVEKISNTQGTFHDFQREEYDARALNDLTLRLPAFDNVIGTNNQHIVGKEQDSLQFIHKVPRHKLIYIDPPYNFRQYTSYYFILNLICSYCAIPNLEKYFANVQFVRGQNMKNNFDSTFCKANLFIPSLKQLIQDANTQYVIMSYYDGRNHENKGTTREDRGIAKIEKLFTSELFIPNSFEIKAFERTNYQSFKDHIAGKCKEFLFIAEKR